MNKNSILVGLSESEKTSFGKLDFADQSVPQQVLSTIWAVESEINNGGFSLYFSSATADSAPFVVATDGSLMVTDDGSNSIWRITYNR